MELVKQLKQAGRIMRSSDGEPHWIQDPNHHHCRQIASMAI